MNWLVFDGLLKIVKKKGSGGITPEPVFWQIFDFLPHFWKCLRLWQNFWCKIFWGEFFKKKGKNRPSRGAKIGVRRISGLKAKSLRESDFDYAILVSPPKHFALLSQNRANFARSSSTNPIIRVCSPDQTFGGGKNRRIWLKKRSRTSVCYHGGYPRKGS